MSSKKIEIEVPNGKKPEWVNGVLALVDEGPVDVKERVKTFEDACRELGEDHPFVLAYRNTNLRDKEVSEDNCDIIAYMKLRIICAALNEGWEPQFTEDEYRWYPWFALWTEEELSEKSDEWKADRHLISTGYYSGDNAGFAYSSSDFAPLAYVYVRRFSPLL